MAIVGPAGKSAVRSGRLSSNVRRHTHMSEAPATPEAPQTDPDVVDVIDRTALIENVLNQIIAGYCAPRKAAEEFMWSVVLDSSVMPLGSKIKVALAVAHELEFRLNRDALHKVVALRNAFAHHATTAYPAINLGARPEQTTTHFELWVLEGSGKIARLKRHEAFADFNRAYRAARQSVAALKDLVCQRFESRKQ